MPYVDLEVVHTGVAPLISGPIRFPVIALTARAPALAAPLGPLVGLQVVLQVHVVELILGVGLIKTQGRVTRFQEPRPARPVRPAALTAAAGACDVGHLALREGPSMLLGRVGAKVEGPGAVAPSPLPPEADEVAVRPGPAPRPVAGPHARVLAVLVRVAIAGVGELLEAIAVLDAEACQGAVATELGAS